jgi:hypothetical protein
MHMNLHRAGTIDWRKYCNMDLAAHPTTVASFPARFFQGRFEVTVLPHILKNSGAGDFPFEPTNRGFDSLVFANNNLSH